MKKCTTVQEWVAAHSGINALTFEANYDKSFGFGSFEEVCGFCLASHYFDGEPPKFCTFCRAPFEEARAISDLAQVKFQRYSINPLELPSEKLGGLSLVEKTPGAGKHGRRKSAN
ncbi:MAG: hypothetical protein ACRD4U_04215 [Candidatus Acidiferrales bacterium]